MLEFYDYENIEMSSDDEEEAQEEAKESFDDTLKKEDASEISTKSRSNGSAPQKLSKSISNMLDEFSLQMAKTKSFHKKVGTNNLLVNKAIEATRSQN